MLYDAFSKRNQVLPDVFVYDAMALKFRNQVHWIWKKSVMEIYSRSRTGVLSFPMLILASERVCAEHGLPHLGDNLYTDGGAVKGLLTENDYSAVLDLIEFSFSISLNYLESDEYFKGLGGKMSEAIHALNHRFRENGMGYEFNESARKLIRVDNMVTHQEIIRPALALLSDMKYAVPNKEFLEALEDFKKSEYHDCLTKCGSSFESVMKIIWEEKQPPHDPKATASALITKTQQLFPNKIPSFFVQPLTLIATTRNQMSGSHGGGTTPRQPPDYIARYILNATASAILFIHETSIS